MVDKTVDINKDYNENDSNETSNKVNINNEDGKKDEGLPISGMVNQETVKQLMEMGYSKNVAEKALFLNQQILEKSIEWIYENQNEPDFEEELRIMGQEEKQKMTPEEIQQKAMELSKLAHEKFLKKEKERAEEQELNRIRMTKDMVKAKKEFEEAETRRFVEQQKRKKLEEEAEKKRMLEILARDKEERFGKKFTSEGSEIKTNPPIEDVHYYTGAIIKLYPTFRCGNQAKDCLNTIKVAINNIIKNPDEEKYRKIKMTNPVVEERLKKIPLGMKILKVLGFVEEGEFEILKKENTDLELLKKASSYLEGEVNKLITQ